MAPTYLLAPDDFTQAPAWDRVLPYIHIIKFDLQTTSLSQIECFIQHLPLTYLTEKVEFERMKSLGRTVSGLLLQSAEEGATDHHAAGSTGGDLSLIHI